LAYSFNVRVVLIFQNLRVIRFFYGIIILCAASSGVSAVYVRTFSTSPARRHTVCPGSALEYTHDLISPVLKQHHAVVYTIVDGYPASFTSMGRFRPLRAMLEECHDTF
jgi:hypothetical protein